MTRKLILCSDGTGNSGGKARGTNVWRFYKAVDTHPNLGQLTFYQDGVGTQAFKLFRLLGGAFGYGLKANIREMYHFLVHNYQPGDDIYLLGFSRGAFTVRALAYMVTVCGVAKADGDPQETERRIDHAMKRYLDWRKEIRKFRITALTPSTGKRFGQVPLEQLVRAYRELGHKPLTEVLEEQEKKWPEKESGDDDLVYRPIIRFIGVWDTVDAVGLPIDELTEFLDWWFHFRFYSYDRFPIAGHNYHALSLDDERHTFHPLMWDESLQVKGQKIEQVWFSGVHSNVGGGYAKDEMAYVSLDWMMEKAEGCGLKLLKSSRTEASEQARVNGKIYDSRAGLASYYRYKPREVDQICDQANAPVLLHESVFQRIQQVTEDYAPTVFGKHYSVPPTGKPHPMDALPDERLKAQSLAEKIVWWRRVTYFLLLVSTLGTFLAVRRYGAMPMPLSDNWKGIFESLPASLSEYIGGFPEKWLYAFSGRWWFLATLVVLFCALLMFRSYLRKRTRHLGRTGWNLTNGTAVHPPAATVLESMVDMVKAIYAPQKIRAFMREKVFPVTAFGLVVLLALLWLFNMHILPPNRDACVSEKIKFSQLPADGSTFHDFHTCNPWYATGISVEKGATYKVQVTGDDNWSDWHIPANANGFVDEPGLRHKLISLFKRHNSGGNTHNQDWFRLIANIGGRQQVAVGRNAEFTAKHNGPLFFYVNDVLCDVCLKGVFAYYRNNQGTAQIHVTKVSKTMSK
ncbi:MAG: DUF2235 domain-containing protein [Candidatus Thiodiazotropha endolucinida]|uniref:DUF2235 domain-containing protein n=1 Tax=Candidatus Thiodiazotropha taylori TaxID=2792791 RepID=A0A9E4TUU4_9GAMM|nr:DUF2235 domain-containing protein [Candidatus Thiodiazotropha taylori]MCW4238306.1 DUF2235 domain-containing protein [Candidatus Thiodiazotropha endolucinida]